MVDAFYFLFLVIRGSKGLLSIVSHLRFKKQHIATHVPGPPKGCFLEVFGYIKATKKQPFGGAGRVLTVLTDSD